MQRSPKCRVRIPARTLYDWDSSDTLQISDCDSLTVQSLQVSIPSAHIRNGAAEQLLVAGGTGGPIALQASSGTVVLGGVTYAVTGSATGGINTLTFTQSNGAALTLAQIEKLFDALRYNNVSNASTTGERVFSISVTDVDGATSDPATFTVTVERTNDLPVIISESQQVDGRFGKTGVEKSEGPAATLRLRILTATRSLGLLMAERRHLIKRTTHLISTGSRSFAEETRVFENTFGETTTSQALPSTLENTRGTISLSGELTTAGEADVFLPGSREGDPFVGQVATALLGDQGLGSGADFRVEGVFDLIRPDDLRG